MRQFALLLLVATFVRAETKTLTLRQALELALAQNPDVLLARLDHEKARDQVTINRDPFVPKVFAGSGAAWTSGYPANINGEAPSIVEAKTQMALFDRPQSYKVAEAHENLNGAEIEVGRQQDEAAYRVASLYLDAEQAERSLQAAQGEVESATRVLDYMNARVAEGREAAIESKKASLAVRRAKNAVESLALDAANAQISLAVALGMKPDDRVRAAVEDRPALTLPLSEDRSIEEALENSGELKRLASNMQEKTLEIKGYRAERLPKVNLVAQYELLAKYYYQNYYSAFQSNSGQLGVSIEVPVLMGRSARAYVSQAEIDIAKYKIEVDRTRARITGDLRHAYQEVKRAESVRDYARDDLDVAREQVSINLAQMGEGRVSVAALETARVLENDKWLAFYTAQHALEQAQLNVMRQTGTLLTALR